MAIAGFQGGGDTVITREAAFLMGLPDLSVGVMMTMPGTMGVLFGTG